MFRPHCCLLPFPLFPCQTWELSPLTFSIPLTEPIRAHTPSGCWILGPTGIQLWPHHLLVSEFKDYPTFSHSTLCTQRHQRHPGAAKSIAKQTQHWAVCSEHAAPLAPDGHSCAIDAAVSFSPLWCRACISISSGNRSVTFPDALLCTAHLLNFFFSCAGCSCLSKYM